MKELTGLRKKDFEAGAKEEREKIVKYLNQFPLWQERCDMAAEIYRGEHNKCQ